MNQEPADFAAAVALLREARAEITELRARADLNSAAGSFMAAMGESHTGPKDEPIASLKAALESLLIFHSSAKNHPLHAAAREVIKAACGATGERS